MNKIENIGYLWLNEKIKTPGGKKTKLNVWWGVCKKTRKVALASIIPAYPLLIQDTSINGKKCFDGDYCLNVNCPYAKNTKLIDSIKATEFGKSNLSNEELLTYFNCGIKYIESDYLKNFNKNDIETIFEDNYKKVDIIENAFGQKLPKNWKDY